MSVLRPRPAAALFVFLCCALAPQAADAAEQLKDAAEQCDESDEVRLMQTKANLQVVRGSEASSRPLRSLEIASRVASEVAEPFTDPLVALRAEPATGGDEELPEVVDEALVFASNATSSSSVYAGAIVAAGAGANEATAKAEAKPHPAGLDTKEADLSGVSLNEAGDLYAFLSAFVTNIVTLVASIVAFMVLRWWFPLVFKSYVPCPIDASEGAEPDANVQQRKKVLQLAEKKGLVVLERDTKIMTKIGFDNRRSDMDALTDFTDVKDKSGKKVRLDAEVKDSSFPVTIAITGRETSLFAWVSAAWCSSTEENAEVAGLDNALLLEFCDLNMRIMGLIMVPMLGIMAPLHYFLGGHAAGGDHMSYLSFGNVEEGSWLYWIHGFVVWYVVLVVVFCVDGCMRGFVGDPAQSRAKDGLRRSWLKDLDHLRAHTIMVEGIPSEPENWRTDLKLKEFFEKKCNFPSDSIRDASVVKDTAKLEKQLDVYRRFESKAEEQQHKRKTASDNQAETEEEKKTYSDLCQAQKEVKSLLEDVKKDSKQGDSNWGVGFVTFKCRRDVEVAKSMLYDNDTTRWMVSEPPPLRDVLWNDLTQSAEGKTIYTVIGTALIIGLYLAYMPLVVGITNVATAVDMGAMQPLWAGLAPTLGLQFMVSFLPTFLIMIYRSFFTLVADAYGQHQLQVAYFWFQIIFVVLITAIGDSVIEFTEAIFTDPLKVVSLMATMMPYATHFYMNFLVLQWVTHAINLTRMVPLMKFVGASKIFGAAKAREIAEPEDQDYYGLGSRNARFTINMVIGIVYSTLSPPIALLTFVNFCVCRLVYGYLLPFAETRKPDLGGVFFVKSLSHLFVGLIIYTAMMTGVLAGRAANCGPAFIAGLSIPLVVWARMRFESKFSWEKLSILDACQCDPPNIQGRYEQPCLEEAENLKPPPARAGK